MSEQTETLSGRIERISFHNPETGFAVLRVQQEGKRALATVVGQLASVSAGEEIKAWGRWQQSRDHGLQFQARNIQTAPPQSVEGVERFLGGGLIKGIGPSFAARLVAKFGVEVLEVIDKYSARLEEVEGVGPKRRKQIKESWDRHKALREIMIFLHSHGVGTGRAMRIYKCYGEEAIARIQKDPYCLARDVAGIGFKTADDLAGRLGIAGDAPGRLRAGLVHVLYEAAGRGHSALPEEMWLEQGVELLGVDRTVLEPFRTEMVRKREIAREEAGDGTWIASLELHEAEQRIAERLAALADGAPDYPEIDVPKALAWVQQRTGVVLAGAQCFALEEAWRKRLLVVTGGPGVGKTTLLKAVLEVFTAKKVKVLLAAPTGRAAQRMAAVTGREALTLHRLLEYKPGGGFGRDEQRPLEAGLVMVDESSMIDVPLMDRLLRALGANTGLLLLGDVDQLPSVGAGRVLGDAISSGRVPVVRLSEIFRQAADSRIIVNAHRILGGEMPETPDKEEDGEVRDFYWIEREDPEAIAATVLEVAARRLPKRLGCDPLTDIQVLSPMNRGPLGTRALNVELQKLLNPAREETPGVERFGWTFRMGDKLIQTRNNYDLEVYNGDIGRVTGLNTEDQELRVRFERREVVYDFGELDELAPAYAVTVHKAQGSEFPVVVIPLAMAHFMMLQRNLIYTAVTRGRRMVVLVGQRRALERAVRETGAQRRFTRLEAFLRAG